MKLGILADIHEHHEELKKAITTLTHQGAEQFVVLGDIFDHGTHLAETIDILTDLPMIGVWGNHDAGFCIEISDRTRQRYSPRILEFMRTLLPRYQIDGCHFSHVEPWLDPYKVEDLWYFDGPPDTPDKLSRSFAAVKEPVILIGHFHRWLLGNSDGVLDWKGEPGQIIHLDPAKQHLVVIHAVWAGHSALFDTVTRELTPFSQA